MAQKKDYTFEYLGIAAVVMYILMYLIGSKANTSVVHAFMDVTGGVYDSNFASTGIPNSTYKGWLQESQCSWKYFSSGRQNGNVMMTQIVTKKRQDMISVILDIINQEDDVVVCIYIYHIYQNMFVLALALYSSINCRYIHVATDSGYCFGCYGQLCLCNMS